MKINRIFFLIILYINGFALINMNHADYSIAHQELNNSIDKVISRPEYTWRMPREKNLQEQKTNFILFVEKTLEYMVKGIKVIVKGIIIIGKWLKKILPDFQMNVRPGKEKSTFDWITFLQGLVFILLVMLASFTVIYLIRIKKGKKEYEKINAVPEKANVPFDLNNENVTSDQLPEEKWIILAEDLIKNGELRLALRAFFLAYLSHLAGKKIIAITKYKSNQDYKIELSRRKKEDTGLINSFSLNVKMFECIWYGMYETTPRIIEDFKLNYEKTKAGNGI